MSANPLVSVIIPTYNRADLIHETLDSILKQTHVYWECIIVDDGSTDDTEKVVGKYVSLDKRFQYKKRPDSRLKGANSCRNYGFELSKGEYVNWFDDDDYMHEQKLEIQVKALKDSAYSFSVCQTLVCRGEFKHIMGLKHDKIISDNTLYDYILHNIVFLTQAPFLKKEFLIKNKLSFDEELQAAQEWEFLCKVLYFSPQYHTCDMPLVTIRQHDNSISLGMKYNKRKWYYFLARKKVYQFLNSKNSFKSKVEIKTYLKDYLKDYFRILLFSNQYNKIFQVYYEVIKPMYGYFDNIKIYLFIYFVKLTGKGFDYRNRIIS